MMKRYIHIPLILIGMVIFAGCSTSYKAKPLPFKTPESFENAVTVGDTLVGARAFHDAAETKAVFGFDILGAGMLPVQVVFDNTGNHPLEIVENQVFLEDGTGELWEILTRKIAHERATKYAKTKKIFKEGAYSGFLGAAAGSLIGAAVGVVTGENVAEAAGKGAAVGAAAGATAGGIGAYASGDAGRSITHDLRDKSLQNRAIEPKSLAQGFLFFPGEAGTPKQLRFNILEKDTGNVHVVRLNF
jgi:hypothetical protein